MTALVGRRVACVQEREEQSVCSARVAQPLGLTSAPRRLCRGGGLLGCTLFRVLAAVSLVEKIKC